MIPTPSRRPLVFVSALLLAVSLAGCGKKEGQATAGAPGAGGPPPAMPVTVIPAKVRKVPVSLDAVGQAEGSREVEIRARINGIIEKRLYQEGDAVRAGQVLFVIDPSTYELTAQQAKAELAQERAKRDLAEMDAKRLQPLAAEKAISQREYDTAVAAARTSTGAIAAAEAKLKEAELNLSYTKVTAPIGGITGRALRSEGSLVTANTDSAMLTTISQVNPIWVRFPLAESDFNTIRGTERNAARVQLLSEDGKVLADNGRLNFTSTTVDQKSGAVQLRAEFANPSAKWLPGQFVKVRVLAGEQSAILVPQNAVLQTDQAKLVMTVGADNKVAPKTVQTGSWIGNDMVITAGLAEGDQVIVDNLVKVRPGAAVQPHPPASGPTAQADAGAPAPAPAPAQGAQKPAQPAQQGK